MQVLKSDKKNIRLLVECQKNCFPRSFAVKLGNACLAKSLQWFFASPHRLLLHVEDNGKIVAFCGGFMPQFIGDGSKSGMLNFAFREALTGLIMRPWLFLHPELWRYGTVFLKTKLKLSSKSAKTTSAEIPDDHKAYLESFAITIVGVNSAYRGQNLAHKLLAAAEEFAKEHEKKYMCLGVKQNNDSAIKAYKKSGWFIEKELDDSYVMRKVL